MAGGGGSKSRQREQAIAALLASPNIESAARSAGIGTRTLKAWLAEPAFAAEYRKARARVVEESIGWLQLASRSAVETLVRNLEAAPASTQVKAATTILELSLRGVEVADVLARLEALEQAQG